MPLFRCYYPRDSRIRAQTFWALNPARADRFAKRVLQPGILELGGGLVYRIEQLPPANAGDRRQKGTS